MTANTWGPDHGSEPAGNSINIILEDFEIVLPLPSQI